MTEPEAFGPPREGFLDASGRFGPLRNRPLLHGRSHRQRPPSLTIVPHWDDVDGDIWDLITLGSYTFGGTVRIQGDGPKLAVDRRRHKGATYTKLITNGFDTHELKIILRVWTPDHLADYEALVKDLDIKRTGKAIVMPVYHPALALAKIDQVMIYGVGLLLPTETQGLFESALSCFEYGAPNPNKNVTATPQVGRVTQPRLDPFFHTNNDLPTGAPNPSQVPANLNP